MPFCAVVLSAMSRMALYLSRADMSQATLSMSREGGTREPNSTELATQSISDNNRSSGSHNNDTEHVSPRGQALADSMLGRRSRIVGSSPELGHAQSSASNTQPNATQVLPLSVDSPNSTQDTSEFPQVSSPEFSNSSRPGSPPRTQVDADFDKTSEVDMASDDINEQSDVSPIYNDDDEDESRDELTSLTQPVGRVDPDMARRLFMVRQGPNRAIFPSPSNTPARNSDAKSSANNESDVEDPVQVFGTPRGNIPPTNEGSMSEQQAINSDNDNDENSMSNSKKGFLKAPGVIEDTPLRSKIPETQETPPTAVYLMNSNTEHTPAHIMAPPYTPVARSKSVAALANPEIASTPTSENHCKLVKWQTSWYPAYIESLSQFDNLRDNSRAILTVLFGTDEISDVRPSCIEAFDLAIGDIVNYKGAAQFEIIKLLRQTENSQFMTDSGYDTVTLKRIPKKQKPGRAQAHVTVPVKDIYMNDRLHKLWKENEPARQQQDAVKRPLPPPVFAPNPSSKRLRGSSFKVPSEVQPLDHEVDGIFSGCVFTITMEGHGQATELARSIVLRGGTVLETGIADVLDIDYDAMTVQWGDSSSSSHFGAIIATRPLKTPKYLEGLAFGWPCLSFQFVADSINENKFLENWSDYVLSAGDSIPIGAPISYDVAEFRERWTEDKSLADQFAQRRLALAGVIAPIYLLDNQESATLRLLLMGVTIRPPVVVSSIKQVPQGSVVFDTSKRSDTLDHTSPDLRLRLSRQLLLDETVVFGREWLIQCIINRRVI